MSDVLTQAILESLAKRAKESSDEFQFKGDRVQVRCFHPEKHKNGDAHPSAYYYLGRYIVCQVCGFKEGEKRLADRLGIGIVEGGLTLSALAQAKSLQVDFLQKWGWRTQRGRDGRAKVLIPWYDKAGVVKHPPAYHIRHYINKDDDSGPRFTWDLPKGVELSPYGLWRFQEFLDAAVSQGIRPYIIIMESETDALTCWLHSIPATGTGGAESWRSEWAAYFVGFDRIVIAQEPGKAGENMAIRVARDFDQIKVEEKHPAILVCCFPEATKDANALHLSVNGDRAKFQESLKNFIAQAIPANQIVDAAQAQVESEQLRQREEEYARLLAIAKPLLENPSVLHQAIHAVENLGVVGERRNIGLLHLQVRSRALPRPVNIEVNSPSSSGKTYTVAGTLALEAEETYYELTAGSEKALIYLGQPLAHRILYIQEPEGLAQGVGFAAIKSLVWEGRLKYDTVVKEDGELVGRHIEKEGPTGLIVTTTRPLEEQISNRLLRIEVDSSIEQTRHILHAIADKVNGVRSNLDLKPWHALSRLLGNPVDVEVAFSHYLADQLSTSTLRIRRDFTHLLTLIQASAVEHQYQRSRTQDGRIVATVADYAHVYSLVNDVFQAAQEEGITKEDRKMVAIVEHITTPEVGAPGGKPVTQAAIKRYIGQSKSQVSYRVNRLIRLGYLVNLADKGKPYQIIPGAPLPEEVPPLPSPCQVAEWVVEKGRSDLVTQWVDPVTGQVHNCAEHIASLMILPDRTTEHCPLCICGPNVGSESSDTNRTPEPHPTAATESSRGSVQYGPPTGSYAPQSDNKWSSEVRSGGEGSSMKRTSTMRSLETFEEGKEAGWSGTSKVTASGRKRITL